MKGKAPSADEATFVSGDAPAAYDETVAVGATGAVAMPGGDLRRVSRADYERGPELARGGMGRIVAARDVRHDRPVALKELLHDTPAMVERFRREALIAARLQHPAIVPIYEAGVWDDGEPFFAMKRVEGRSLDAVIAESTELRDRLALLPNVIAVAEALAYAHARGVIHRDLKPHNVLVGDYGETVVIDWGLAKQLGENSDLGLGGGVAPTATTSGDLTVAGSALGTPAYMPPEQARGEEVDPRADVYSIGAILYHLLSGMVPYGGARTARDLLARVATVAPTPLADLQLELPDDLLTIVDKAMARDPAGRYNDAGELAADLKRYAGGQLVSAHRYTLRAMLRRWAQRHRILLGAVGVGAACAIAGLALYLRAVGAEQDATDRQRRRADELRVEAEANLARAREQTMVLFEEQGAARLAGGQPLQAAAYLSKAYAMGNRSASLRFMLAEAMPAAESLPIATSRTAIKDAALAADGARMLTTDADGGVTIWDTANGKVVETLYSKGEPIVAAAEVGNRAVAYWPNGDGAVIDATTGAIERELEPLSATAMVAMSRDGAWVAALTAEGSLKITSVSGPQRWLVPTYAGAPASVAVSRDGAHVLTRGVEGMVKVWRTSDGTLARTAHGHDATLTPDGAHLVVATSSGVEVVTLATGATRAISDLRLEQLAVSPDGSRLIAVRSGTAIAALWELGTGTLVATLTGHDRAIRGVAFDHAGARVITASWDRTARVWDAATGRQLAVLRGHGEPIADVAFLPDDTRALTIGAEAVRLWPPAVLSARVELDAVDASDVAFVDGGRHVATASPTGVRLWDPATGASLGAIAGTTGAWRLVAHPSGDGMAVAIKDHVVVLDRTGAARATLTGHTAEVVDVQYDATGGRIVTASDDTTLRVWDATTGALVRSFDTGHAVFATAFTPDGLSVLSSTGTGVVVWDVATGTRLATLPASHVFWFAARGDGERLVTTGYHETIVWDLRKRRRITTLHGHTGSVADAAWTPDGELLLTAGDDSTVRVWNAEAGKALATIGLDGSASAVTIAPDGSRVAVLGIDGTVRIVPLRLEARTPDEIAAIVARNVPWVVDDSGRLVAK